ncbi:unnamed protein product [Camellia sinensis]
MKVVQPNLWKYYKKRQQQQQQQQQEKKKKKEEEEEEEKEKKQEEKENKKEEESHSDWDSAKRCFDEDESALTAKINNYKETALHIAIMSGRSIEFVEKLVDLMPPEALALRNYRGCTAINCAALYGNTKATVILVEKHPTSLYIHDNQNWLPLHYAANNGHKDTLLYLLSVTKEDDPVSKTKEVDPVSKPFTYPSGALLLLYVVYFEFYGEYSFEFGRYPELATSIVHDDTYALKAMARKASSFPSGIPLNRWQRLIYS